MFVTTVKKKIKNKWEVIPTLDDPDEWHQFMKAQAGEEVVIELVTSSHRRFYCGTEELRDMMLRKFPDAMVMTTQDVVTMEECAPEHFKVAIQAFFIKEDAAVVFPEKPKSRW